MKNQPVFVSRFVRPSLVRKFVKSIVSWCILSFASVGSAYAADDCKKVDADSTIAALIGDNEENKVLKVEESKDSKGCTVLMVRILIDGTVKVITIPEAGG